MYVGASERGLTVGISGNGKVAPHIEKRLHNLALKTLVEAEGIINSHVEVFWIESYTTPGKKYEVNRYYGGAWTCTCPDQTNRGGTCKHIHEAMGRRGHR